MAERSQGRAAAAACARDRSRRQSNKQSVGAVDSCVPGRDGDARKTARRGVQRAGFLGQENQVVLQQYHVGIARPALSRDWRISWRQLLLGFVQKQTSRGWNR